MLTAPFLKLKKNYNLKNKTSVFYSQINQDKLIAYMLNSTELSDRNAISNGLFVEAGAYDGETWSNTLYLEKVNNWTGLLIEPSIENYRLLRNKNRNSYSVNSCLCSGDSSVKSYIEAGPFGITTNVSTASSSSASSSSSSSSSATSNTLSPIYSITCHPLTKILDEFFYRYPNFKNKKSRISTYKDTSDQVVIDYMSIDIEGNERPTLDSFDWKKYKFNLLNIEYNQNKELYNWVKSYLKQFGYKETIVDDVWYQDIFLAHESTYPLLNLSLTKMSDLIKVL